RCVGDHRLHVLGLGEVGAGGLVGGQLAAFPQADFQRPGRRVDQQIGRVDAALMLLVARREQDGAVLLKRGLGLHIGRQNVELGAQQRLQVCRDRAVFEQFGFVRILADLSVQSAPVRCRRGGGVGRGGSYFNRRGGRLGGRRRFRLVAGGQRQGRGGDGDEGQAHQ